MALDYSIYIGEKDVISYDEIFNILSNFKWNPEIESIGKKSTLFLIDNTIGFNIYVKLNVERVLEIESKEQKFNTVITFRVNKDFDDPIIYKKNMLRLVLELFGLIKVPMLLLFNGEIVILKAAKREITIGKTDFWDDELKNVFIKIGYKEQKFDVL